MPFYWTIQFQMGRFFARSEEPGKEPFGNSSESYLRKAAELH